jgi:SAM-dependent methyltransferase
VPVSRAAPKMKPLSVDLNFFARERRSAPIFLEMAAAPWEVVEVPRANQKEASSTRKAKKPLRGSKSRVRLLSACLCDDTASLEKAIADLAAACQPRHAGGSLSAEEEGGKQDGSLLSSLSGGATEKELKLAFRKQRNRASSERSVSPSGVRITLAHKNSEDRHQSEDDQSDDQSEVISESLVSASPLYLAAREDSAGCLDKLCAALRRAAGGGDYADVVDHGVGVGTGVASQRKKTTKKSRRGSSPGSSHSQHRERDSGGDRRGRKGTKDKSPSVQHPQPLVIQFLDDLLPHPQHRSGWRAVHVAAARGHVRCLEILSGHRADMWSSPPGFNFGGSPRDFADVEGHADAVAFLEGLPDPRLAAAVAGDSGQRGVEGEEARDAGEGQQGGAGDRDRDRDRVVCAYGDGLSFSLRRSSFQSCGTGFTVWPAAQVMARWLHSSDARMSEFVRGKRVLDLGCGPGLLSLFAARHGAASVVASDETQAILDLAAENAEYCCGGQLARTAHTGTRECSIPISFAVLDWMDVVRGTAGDVPEFDVAIGSDLVYGDRLSRLLARALSILLQPPPQQNEPHQNQHQHQKVFLGCMQANRTGVAEFPARARLMGLEVSALEVPKEFFYGFDDPPGWVVYRVTVPGQEKG